MRVWMALVVLRCGLGSADLNAQKQPAAKTEPKMPVYGLEISGEPSVAAQLPSQVYDLGFGCTSNGSIGVNVLLPPDKAKPRSVFTFYTISPSGKTVTFDFSKINDLALRSGQRATAYEVGDRDVDFLFSAVPVKSAAGLQGEDKAPPPGWFVARFDRDGTYHGATELNLPRLVPQRFAAFDDGDLLIFALDEANRQPQLIRYSMIGQKVHYYFADAEFAKKNPNGPTLVAKGTNPDQGRLDLAQLRMSMQLSQFGHWKEAIVLLQSEGAPLFLAYPDGSVRTVKLPKVDGYGAQRVIPSDEELYVEYRRPSADPNGPDEILILELEGNTGEELRRIAPGELELACVHQGSFRVIRHEGQHTFHLFSATVVAGVESNTRVPASK
jgi:hypothetical protein